VSTPFWYRGELLLPETKIISADDPGFIYGATVFTTLRVYNKSLAHPLTHWQAHCDRLLSSIIALNWIAPDWQSLQEGANILAQDYPILRLTIFHDGRELIIPRYLPDNLAQLQQTGITGKLVEGDIYRRYLPVHKTGNYLGAWLAKRGISEAILTDVEGNWVETSTGNLWGYRDGCWYITTPGDSLPGIIQQQLVNWLEKQSIAVVTRRWTPDWVTTLEAIAYTNSAVEVIPFHSVETSITTITVNPHLNALTQLRSYFNFY